MSLEHFLTQGTLNTKKRCSLVRASALGDQTSDVWVRCGGTAQRIPAPKYAKGICSLEMLMTKMTRDVLTKYRGLILTL